MAQYQSGPHGKKVCLKKSASLVLIISNYLFFHFLKDIVRRLCFL